MKTDIYTYIDNGIWLRKSDKGYQTVTQTRFLEADRLNRRAWLTKNYSYARKKKYQYWQVA